MHYVPPLPHDFRGGVPGLLSAEGFDIAWTQYMTVTLEKLNAHIAGTCSVPRPSCSLLPSSPPLRMC